MTSSHEEPALSLAQVLGEEYAALHPEDTLPEDSTPSAFSASDVADLPGLAHALLDGVQQVAATDEMRWYLHPPAPTSTMLDRVAAVVVHDQTALVELLRELVEGPRESTDAARVKQLIAARLTELLATDLEHDSAFAPLLPALHAQDDGQLMERPAPERNRFLLECALSAFLLTSEDRRLATVLERMHSQRHAALCLSGGGIRSASFAMGVVQGLARRGLLSRFHYLSTVSGGGYTGSWLSAWMARAGSQRVHEQLGGVQTGKPDAEPAPLHHIRSYSYYLTPRFGLFSADTWTLIATIGRNVLLIWLVTLPVLAAALMLPRFLVAGPMTTLRDWNQIGLDPADVMVVLMAVGTVLAIGALSFVHRHLYTYSGREDGDGGYSPVTLKQFHLRCLIPLVVAMVALAQSWEMLWSFVRFSPEEARRLAEPLSHRAWTQVLIDADPSVLDAQSVAVAAGVAFWVFVYLAGGVIGARGRRYRVTSMLLSALSGLFAGAIGGYLSARLFGLTEWLHPPEFYATLSVPLSLSGLLIAKQLVVGFASRQMTDAERESNARFSAWLLITIVGWIGIVGLALYGPVLLNNLIGDTMRLSGVVGLSGLTGLIASITAATSQLPTGSAKSSFGASKVLMAFQRAAIALITPVFAATVIVLVSMFDGKLLGVACVQFESWCPPDDPVGVADLFHGRVTPFSPADYATPHLVFAAFIVVLLVAYVLGRLIDTNRFSLHAMYRVRLVRTFLGASKPPGEREPNPFTGFDETDDLPMRDLWPATKQEHGDDGSHPPLHVLNLTLNLVAGSKLATQSRKATAFTVTSLHAGSADVGYRRTSAVTSATQRLYGGHDGISLGTAMAISGAAASPNAGYHSSPAVTFLMTLFNARLGWWLGNPGSAGKDSYGSEEPKLALQPILDEMFGRTTDTSPYIYLSDGGHFENLGLYEMVRRRCRFIVVSDAGCDPKASYDDLGGAIRKIRIDFGIPIEFDSGIPIYSRDSSPAPADARYWAVGRILFSQADGRGAMSDAESEALDGVLLYIKPAFYGREAYDVYNYGMSTPEFPHESTANQFFGEAQFESYRALGLHAVNSLCESEFGVAEDSDEQVTRARFDEWFAADKRFQTAEGIAQRTQVVG